MKKVFKKVATSALAATLVLPAGIAGAATKFPDVNPNTVTPDVQQAIEALAEQGIIQGFPDGTFGPNKSITRAQFAKILAQVKGLKPNPAAAAQFTDVKDPEQRGWVGALVEAGLTTGTTPTTYSPNRPIQRDQAATFLVRALGLEEVAKELDLTPTTTDGARINASHKANVGLLEKIGLVKGYPNGAYGPGDPFKRQQAANLLYKVQQEGDTYVAAAHALLNKVEVVYNDNGTLTIKGSIKGAVTVDVVVKDTEGNVLYEQKGVSAEDGAFEVTTNYVGQKDVVVTVTAYDAEGNVVSTLEQQAKAPAEGEVKGYTDAPDLIRAYSEGKYVYFVFDEPVNKILDEDAFYIISWTGGKTNADKAYITDDKHIVKADFYDVVVPVDATFAGIEEGAVKDEDGNESIESAVPLNDADLTSGRTGGPDLVSVKVDTFKLRKDGDRNVKFEVEYVFDEKISKVVGDAYNFVLFLKDGTILRGYDIVNDKSDAVEVEFVLSREDDTIISHTKIGDIESDVSKRYQGKEVDRDDVAIAAVLYGQVEDDHDNPDGKQRKNPYTVTKARTSMSANYLRSAELDIDDGEIDFKFDRTVDDIDGFSLKDSVTGDVYDYIVSHFGLYKNTGETKTFLQIAQDAGVSVDDIIEKVSVDGKEVTVELVEDSRIVAQELSNTVGVFVLPMNLDADDEKDRIIGGAASLKRVFKAGDFVGPVLKKYDVDYDEDDELLTVRLTFSQEIKEVDKTEDRIILYDAEGNKITGTVDIDDVKDDEIVIEIEVDEDDHEDIVAIAIELGFVESDEDNRVGLPSAPAVFPYKK